MFDKDLFLSLCEKYDVELSETASSPMIKVGMEVHAITNDDVNRIFAPCQTYFEYSRNGSKILRGDIMTEKEKLIEYINKPVLTDARNRMGCSENWYNAYYAIKETFSIDEIKSMDNKEIKNLVKLADSIGEALY